MEQFNFEKWWKYTVYPHAWHHTSFSPLCHLSPLYEKMREWGYDGLVLDWRKNFIRVFNDKDGYVLRQDYDNNINDFPRALHDAFKWMYENRVNNTKGTCDKDGPCDNMAKFLKGCGPATTIWTGDNFRFCPFCGEKR